MLRCINAEGSKIYAFEPPEDIRAQSYRRTLLCPSCQTPVIYHRKTDAKRAYFAHLALGSCTYSEIETEEAKIMKEILFRRLDEIFPGLVEIEEEFFIDGEKHLAAIVMSEKKWVFEVHTSNMRRDKWHKINQFYENAGLRVIWIFGYSMHRNKREECGINQNSHRLKYIEKAIFEEPKQKLIYIDTETHEVVLLPTYNITPIEKLGQYATPATIRGSVLNVVELRFDISELIFSEKGELITPFDAAMKEALTQDEERRKRRQEEITRTERSGKTLSFTASTQIGETQKTSPMLEKNRREKAERLQSVQKDAWERLASRLGVSTTSWPHYLNLDIADREYVFAVDKRLWQGWIALEFFLDKPRGSEINPVVIADSFRKRWLNALERPKDKGSELSNAIYSFLRELADRGILKDTNSRLFILDRNSFI